MVRETEAIATHRGAGIKKARIGLPQIHETVRPYVTNYSLRIEVLAGRRWPFQYPLPRQLGASR